MFNNSHQKETSPTKNNNNNRRNNFLSPENTINESFYSCYDDNDKAMNSIDSNHLTSTRYPFLQKRRHQRLLSSRETNYDDSSKTSSTKNRANSNSFANQDLVIYTSINANSLKVCRVSCTNCSHSSENIYKDAQFYSNILQLFIGRYKNLLNNKKKRIDQKN